MASKGSSKDLKSVVTFALVLLAIGLVRCCFLLPSAPRVAPRPASSADVLRSAATGAEPELSLRAVPAGILAFAVAAALALGSPQPASAGLLSEGGKVDYEEAAKANIAGKRFATKQEQVQSRAQVLEYAAAKAKETARRKAIEAEEKQKAEDLFKRLAEAKKAEESAAAAKAQKQEEQRAKVLKQLEKSAAKSSSDASTSKAEGLFAKFFLSQQAKEQKAEAEAVKQDKVRETVLTDLEKKKAEAAAAAKEAEAIAQRIEELAKNARQAAEVAKKSAAALD